MKAKCTARDMSQKEAKAPGPAQINTEGKVTGEVRSTVDQQGKVSAPQSIQLTGRQRGVGASRMNVPPPG